MKIDMKLFNQFLLSIFFTTVAFSLSAAIEIISPKAGDTVCQLRPAQKKYVGESMAEREKYFDGAENARALKKDRTTPLPVTISWVGGESPWHLSLTCVSNGKLVAEWTADKLESKIDSLEIGEEYELVVTSGEEKGKVRFFTEDVAPRLICIDGVSNARDVGGWRGLDGRRIRQGLLYRTSGLNNNAPIEYYKSSEIDELYKTGKLVTMGSLGKSYARKLDRGKKISDKDSRLIKRKCFKKGTKRLKEEERKRILARYGFKTDIDLRSDVETYGMEGSPLGDGVKWIHSSIVDGYGGFVKDESKKCKIDVFKVLFDRNAYPIVFHCIGGADRTGTIAFMLEALLGVNEDDLAKDYLITGFGGGVSDPKHKGWFDGMMKSFRALPGNTPAEKMEKLLVKWGFTMDEITAFREFMLEPKEK